jgi:hypothetical protein
MRVRLALVLAAVLSLFGSATVYTNQNFENYQAQHRLLAILPPTVSINALAFKPGTEPSAIRAQEGTESELLYRQLYSQLLKQFGKDRYTIEFQDIEETQAMLAKAGIDATTIRSKTKTELATALGVDALLSLRVYRDQPMSTGEALFSVLVAGASMKHEVQANLSIYDGESGQLLWNFDHLIGGGLVSSAEGMTRSLMTSVSKKFPYRKPKRA